MRRDDPGEASGTRWRRHPADVARLLLAAAVAGLTLGLTALEPDGLRELSGDLVVAVRRLPDTLTEALLGIAQLVAVVLPVVALVWLAWVRWWRTLAMMVVAAGAAAGVVVAMQGWLDRLAPPEIFDGDSWVVGAAFPSGAYVSGLAAAAVVLLPMLRRPWRRALVGVVATFALARVLTAAVVPFHVVTHLALGVTVGSALLVAFGAPVRRVALGEVAAALAAAGLPVGRLTEMVAPVTTPGGERSRRYRTTGEDGRVLEVEVVGVDERDADLLERIVRAIRFKGIADDRPGWTPERVVHHEALSALTAERAGVPTAPVEAVAVTASGDGVLAFAARDAVPLAELPPDAVTDQVLDATWRAVAALHRRRTAHRWLSPQHVGVDASRGEVALTGFRWSRLAAPDTVLDLDVANLLAGLSAVAGADRAVATALGVLGRDRLVAALPYLQRPLLTPDVRAAVDTTRLAAVTDAVRAATGADEVQLAELRRVSVGSVVGLLGTGFLVYVALSFASNWSEISDALGRADWTHAPILLVLSGLGYPAGAASLMGAVPVRLPFGETNQVMLAQTYLNRFTPANAGGMALRTRYLQRHGLELPSAATSVGLTSAASGVMQLVLLIVLGIWAGSSTDIGFSLPSVDTIVVVILVVTVAAGVLYATPWGRRVVFGWLTTTLHKVLADVRSIASSPSKLVLLFGGALAAKLATILAFTQACRMVGVEEAFPVLALLYMTANTVASAAPTPGGLGAIEAALVIVLQGIGVASDDALAAVLLFRLATYWLPTLPSWLMLIRVRRQGLV